MRCIGRALELDCRSGWRSVLLRIRDQTLVSAEERTQLQSLSRPASGNGYDSGDPESQKDRAKKEKRCVVSNEVTNLHKVGKEYDSDYLDSH